MIRSTLAATVVIFSLSSCSGTIESALEAGNVELAETQVQGTVQTSTTISDATNDSTSDTTDVEPEPAAEPTTTTEPVGTLPGNGAALASTSSEIDGWTYYGAQAWTAGDGTGDEAHIWTSSTAQISIRPIDVPVEIVAERRTQLEQAAVAEFGDLRIYGGDYYYHTGGYEAVWSRFDWVQDDAWNSIQRFWVIADSEVLEITLTGNDPQAFDDELFLLQGVINELDRP